MSEDNQGKRRSSSRSIKRKKFDDEVVESSISNPRLERRQRNISLSGALSLSSSGVIPVEAPVASTSVPPPAAVPEAGGKRPQRPPTAASKRRRHRDAHKNAVKDIGRWKPQDDLALVLGVIQTNDLEDVFRGVKFSCRFTGKEIADRWYALLYDPTIAKIAVSAMRQLHPDIIAQVHRKVLFSQGEEDLLKTIPSTGQPTLETFEGLLVKNPESFLAFRTGRCLQTHWTLMKHYHLLPDQTLQPLPRHDDVVTFSDAEELVERDAFSLQGKHSIPGLSSRMENETLNHELSLADRKAKREIRQLENEIPKWQVLVDSITGVAPSDFDNCTLAVLRGRLVRYLMRSKEITLGRSTKDSVVDVDLSLEGPAFKISRKQGLIKLLPSGDFMISNTGKRQIHVDSKPVLGGGNCAKINNNSVIEVSGLRFVFLINQDLIASVRAEALKSQL